MSVADPDHAGRGTNFRSAAAAVDAALAAARRHPLLFEELAATEARAHARQFDVRRAGGGPIGALAGMLVSVKANVDVRGLVTTAGSAALAGRGPASRDAEIVRRLRAADAVILGHTRMTELAESAVGWLPGLPNPLDPGVVAGGSSTGDAVAVAREIVSLAVATDEGGSARIPSAFCGVVGFRPSSGTLPRQGILPLSPTLDGPGLIAARTSQVIRAFTALSGHGVAEPWPARLAVPRDYVWDGCEPPVRAAVESAIARLADHLPVTEIALPELHDLAALRKQADFAAAETAAWLRSADVARDLLGPLARARAERGERMTSHEYRRVLTDRRNLIARIDARTTDWDVLLMPTVPRLPPRFDGLTAACEAELNASLLHTTCLANLLDRPAISLPTLARPSTGLMLVGAAGLDGALLRLAARAEEWLQRGTTGTA